MNVIITAAVQMACIIILSIKPVRVSECILTKQTSLENYHGTNLDPNRPQGCWHQHVEDIDKDNIPPGPPSYCRRSSRITPALSQAPKGRHTVKIKWPSFLPDKPREGIFKSTHIIIHSLTTNASSPERLHCKHVPLQFRGSELQRFEVLLCGPSHRCMVQQNRQILNNSTKNNEKIIYNTVGAHNISGTMRTVPQRLGEGTVQ